jgi:hypothetical protein
MKKIIGKLLNILNPSSPSKLKLEVREGIAGLWHYHLSSGGKKGVLCGNDLTWPTSLSLDSWGLKSPHIGETYCKECDRLAKDNENWEKILCKQCER